MALPHFTDALAMSLRLQEIHTTMKRSYGLDFPARVAEIEPQLAERAKKHDGNTTAAAVHWSRESGVDPRLALLVLAVAMELILRAKKPV